MDFIDAFKMDHLQLAELKRFPTFHLYTEPKSGKGKQQRLKMGNGRHPRVDYIDAFKLDHLQPIELKLFPTFHLYTEPKSGRGNSRG